ncbi:uncharacterized protein KD926_008508 [Aspergillus affinis]|uniref:uncharacterized protein n=1 Tax=Aspergillus affinis TaxID=1070780 RepID=UPI0022FE062F|nr:uncharacterized protein KD926_008508 [Aspergillus affinis]KAI9040185.1 hypothetical protein KD926_008508 [Aspergillus affinis]
MSYGALLTPIGKSTDLVFPSDEVSPEVRPPAADQQNNLETSHELCPVLSPESRYTFHETLPWQVFSRNEDAGAVAFQLLQDNWYVFKHLYLDTWVQQAMGRSPAAIVAFNTYYNRLSYSLLHFLGQYPEEIEKYTAVVTLIRRNDLFLSMAISYAVRCRMTLEPFEPLTLNVDCILLPLKAILSNPDKHIIRRLTALEVRYRRYLASPTLAQGDEFPINTEFLIQISESSPDTVALQLSAVALREFHQLSLHSVQAKTGALPRLGIRWDRLCRETEEAAVVPELGGALQSLVLDLYNLRNFFALTAVLSGLSLAGQRPEPINHLFDFVNSEGNYRRYRTTVHEKPSLPFLYPLIIDYTRGNQKALQDIFGFLHYHHFLKETKERIPHHCLE